MAPPQVQAAGGVVTRVRKGKREYLIVHRPKYDDWSLPKGKLEEAEGMKVAARREVEEETGYRVALGLKLGTIGYRARNRSKIVRYWLMEVKGGEFRANAEVDDIRWLRHKDALQVLSHRPDRRVVSWAHDAAGGEGGILYLVRHALAGSRSKWKGADFERPLSKTGRRQVAGLVRLLLKHPVGRVASSPYVRCIASVAPLGTAINEKVAATDWLAEEKPPAAAAERLVHWATGRAGVASVHGFQAHAVLERAASSGVLRDPPRAPKGSLWLFRLRRGQFVSGRYYPPRRGR